MSEVWRLPPKREIFGGLERNIDPRRVPATTGGGTAAAAQQQQQQSRGWEGRILLLLLEKIQILEREKKGGRMGAFKHLLILLSGVKIKLLKILIFLLLSGRQQRKNNGVLSERIEGSTSSAEQFLF